MFSRIVCVNRGEAAARLINAVADLRGAESEPRVIALHTAAERGALFARLADETVEIGGDSAAAASSDTDATASPPGNPYLDYDELERAIVQAQADAVWVGWGFVAEHPDFADLCERLGVTFIGPSGDVMRLLGDKIGSKFLAEGNSVPVAPWSNGALESYEQAIQIAEQVGYPVMVKATAGGGGRGIRRVDGPEGMAEGIDRAQREALTAFGDPTLFLEKVIENARHIEVQIAADNHGNAWALGVRDCSVQRRNQKLIEESSSPVLTRIQQAELSAAAVRLVKAADYRGLGTVEFLYQPEDGRFSFLEVNTRIQVEHPVTETTTGIDLVRLQLQLAAGWELSGDSPEPFGHAIEARLNAEDPSRGFAPAPGMIDVLRFAGGPGIRIDSGFAEGDVIPSEYDSMIAKIIATGADRDEARRRLRRALKQTTVVISGGTTNKAFLLDLLDRPAFATGEIDTGWLDRDLAQGAVATPAHAEVAVVAAAVQKFEQEQLLARDSFFASAARGRPNLRVVDQPKFDLGYGGQRVTASVSRITPRRYLVDVEGSKLRVDVDHLSPVEARVTIGDVPYRTVSMVDGPQHRIEVDGVDHQVSLDDGGVLRSPSPALVVSVLASPGATVARGAPLVVVEAMKVETALTAPIDGVVTEVLVSPNTQIDTGTVLVKLDPVADGDDSGPGESGDQLDFTPLAISWAADDAHDECLSLVRELKWNVLGFGRAPEALADLIAQYRSLRSQIQDPTEALLGEELGVLRAFADVASLSRNRPADEVEAPETHSPQEYFHRYLRALDVEAEGLSPDFQARLGRALSHYGVSSSSERSLLERAVFGIATTQHRSREVAPLVIEVLNFVELGSHEPSSAAASRLRATFDDLVIATQLRHPAIGRAARNRRESIFEAPLMQAARDEALQTARAQLDALAANPNDPTRRDLIDALVASPYRLVRLLADPGPGGAFADRIPLVEVLARRNYVIRNLTHLAERLVGEQRLIHGSWREEARTWNVLSTVCDRRSMGEAIVALRQAVDGVSPMEAAVLDLYVRTPGPLGQTDRLIVELMAALNASPYPSTVERITVTAVDTTGRVQHITFRPDTPGRAASVTPPAGGIPTSLPEVRFVEDPVVRGLHPMIAERLQVGRLTEFSVQRVDSPEDTYLFHCIGRNNPKDVRLFAAAEVRNMTAVRGSDGRVVALPELERVLNELLNGMRAASEEFPVRERPSWNRVQLYVWPVVDIPFEDFQGIAERVAPLTANLGIELVTVQARVRSADGSHEEIVVRFSTDPGQGLSLEVEEVPTGPLKPLDAYAQNVLRSRLRGAPYPFEIVRMLTGAHGLFIEYDLENGTDGQVFVPVERDPGLNSAGVVVGVVSVATQRYPDGMTRVAILGDPTQSLGSIAEAECARIMAAIDLAELMGVPVEWFALSSGARIAMDSGTENMDWISRVLRRIVNFTQAGGEINVVVTGINVGAQPYWNAEATMLMHTKGILVMTPDSAMVLTGKQALDFSGGVSAEDNFGIGGFDRIMGPNGQAQYWAPDLRGAVDILHSHYEHAYVASGEMFPRSADTTDPRDRDVRTSPHEVEGLGFTTVGDIFSDEANPGRKKPFDIRSLMAAVADQDHPTLERWAPMRDAESVVVLDAHLGGIPISLLGVESQPTPRRGQLPADGPDQWTAGTLFPMSSKKMARAINAASGSRPLVVLANLSGFDGSPESLSRLQLEFGAEIGRSVVNFEGPIVFCVVSRFHGGAFVVFSGALHDNMQVLAVEGTYASVLGGAPAAAVVFAGEVRRRVEADARVSDLRVRAESASPAERSELLDALSGMRDQVQSEMRGDVAAEFDAVHSIERAERVGSVNRIVAARSLRPELIAAVERGMLQAQTDTSAAEASDAEAVVDVRDTDDGVAKSPSGRGLAAERPSSEQPSSEQRLSEQLPSPERPSSEQPSSEPLSRLAWAVELPAEGAFSAAVGGAENPGHMSGPEPANTDPFANWAGSRSAGPDADRDEGQPL